MKAFEKLLSLSAIKSCATAAEHFCSMVLGSGTGQTIFISNNELAGILEVQDEITGILEVNKNIIGVVQNPEEIKGVISFDEIKGIVENENDIKGNAQCQ